MSMELRVGGKYKVTKRLGQGAFGDIYAGVNVKTNEEVAIKLELLSVEKPQLQYEAQIYQILQGNRKFSLQIFIIAFICAFVPISFQLEYPRYIGLASRVTTLC